MREPWRARPYNLVVLPFCVLAMVGCRGNSNPSPPPSLAPERYREEILAAQSTDQSYATLLGIRTSRHGLYFDVLVDAGDYSMSRAAQLAQSFQERDPGEAVEVRNAAGMGIPLRRAVIDPKDYFPFRSMIADSLKQPITEGVWVDRSADRRAVIQTLVVATESPLPPGPYSGKLVPRSRGLADTGLAASQQEVSFVVRR